MKKVVFKFVTIVAVASVFLTGCARNLGANTYVSSATVGKVLEGTVISATAVTIKDTDQLGKNGVGTLGGGIMGGILGSSIGKGKGSSLGAGAGAIAGGLAGAYIQDKLSTSQGFQYVVRLDPKYISEVPKSNTVSTKNININRTTSVDDEIKSSIAVENTRTDLLSVVQGGDVVIGVGQRVLIIYNNDRPRLTPIL